RNRRGESWDALSWPPPAHRTARWGIGRGRTLFKSCSARRFSSNCSEATWKWRPSSPARFSFAKLPSRDGPQSGRLPRDEAPFNRRDGLLADDLGRPGGVQDDEPSRLREAIVIRGDPTEERDVLERNLVGSVLDPFESDLRRDPKQDRQIGRKDPILARPLEEADGIVQDSDQVRALVGIGGIRIAVAKDDLPALEVRTNLWDVCGAIREEQEGPRERADALLDSPTNGLPQPVARWFARQEDGVAPGPEAVLHEPTHGGLAGPVNSLERNETGEHGRGTIVCALNRRRPPSFPISTTFLSSASAPWRRRDWLGDGNELMEASSRATEDLRMAQRLVALPQVRHAAP